MSRNTATIRYEPGHFNELAFANIPGGWTVFPDNGCPKMCCDSLEEAREVAERFGYRVTVVKEPTP